MYARHAGLLVIVGLGAGCGERTIVAQGSDATSTTSSVASSSSVGAGGTGGVGAFGAGGAGAGAGGFGAGGNEGPGNGVISWSKRFGGQGTDTIIWPSIDPITGDSVLSGTFETSIDFGLGPMTGVGQHDAWLAELDPAGSGVASSSFFATGGTESVSPFGITRDALGETTVGGLFQQQVDFGGGPLLSAGSYDFFLARFDAAGNHLWSRRFGDAADQCPYGGCWLSVDSTANGDVIVGGSFTGTIDLGGGPLVSAGGQDAVVARFSSTGSHQWSYRVGSAGNDSLVADCDPTGRILIAGWFSYTLALPGVPMLTSVGEVDAVVAELDGAGSALWATSFGGAGNDGVIAVDGGLGGQIAVSGTFEQSLILGGASLVGTGSWDGFVARLDATGAPLWAAAINTSEFLSPTSVALGDSGVLVAAGAFSGDIDFGSGSVPTVDVAADGFVAAWAQNGTLIATQLVAGEDFQYAGITHRSADDFLLWGMFTNTIDLGTGPLTSEGSADIFVAAWTP